MKRTSCYRNDLVEAIRKYLPCQFFAQWRLPKGLRWTPQRLLWMALLMTYSAEQTLADRFDAVGDVLKTAFPHWRLGRSYSGWFEAQARWLQPFATSLLKLKNCFGTQVTHAGTQTTHELMNRC